MKNLPPLTTLAERLTHCADLCGSKRALAQAAHISEAQLFRYLRGEAEPTAGKLHALATAAHVDPGWLLTGIGSYKQETFLPYHSDYYCQLNTLLEKTLWEMEVTIPHNTKAQILDVVYLAQLHEAAKTETLELPETGDLLAGLYFLNSILKNNLVEEYRAFVKSGLTQETEPLLKNPKTTSIINHICRANIDWFDSAAGKTYFDRTGLQPFPSSQERLTQLIEYLTKQKPSQKIVWLDLGCGNARELSFIHRHFEHVQVHGVEKAPFPLAICQDLEASGKLPPDAVKNADIRQIPYLEKTFDCVYSRQTAHYLPWFPSLDAGLPEFFKEVHRVLKPDGVFCLFSREGTGQEFLPFCQLLTQPDIEKLAGLYGFELLWYEPTTPGILGKNDQLSQAPSRYQRSFHCLLRKKPG